MARSTTTTLLLLFTTVLLFVTFYRFTPLFDHHSSSPSNHHQPRKDLVEAPTIFIFNQTELDQKSSISNTNTSLELLNLDELRNVLCNLEPAWPVLYEKDTVMLSEKNFSDFLAKNRYVMVLFYMFWCPPCRKMAPEYAAAAKKLKGLAELAVVDAFVEVELREKYNIREYPSMYLFVNGGERLYQFMWARHRYVMVTLYASWCYWSKKMAHEYAEDAKMLKGEAVFAMVDGYVGRELGKKYNIHAYPTTYFFVGGVKQYNFWEEITRDAITTWVKRKMALGIYNVTTRHEAAHTLNAESRLVLGYLDSLEDSESEELAAASKMQSDVNFYQTDRPDVAELFHIDPQIKRPALIMLHTVSRNFSIFHGQFTRLAISDFVSKIKHPLVVIFTLENAELIFQNPMKQLWLFGPAYGSESVLSTFEEAAENFRGKLLFVYLEMNYEGVGKQIAHQFGITADAPRVIAYREHDAKMHVFDGELTLSNIKSFGEDFLEDKLLSQSVPTSDSVLKLPSHSRASHQLRFGI